MSLRLGVRTFVPLVAKQPYRCFHMLACAEIAENLRTLHRESQIIYMGKILKQSL